MTLGLFLVLALLALRPFLKVKIVEVDSGQIGHIQTAFLRLPEWHSTQHGEKPHFLILSHNFVANSALLRILKESFGATFLARASWRGSWWTTRLNCSSNNVVQGWHRPLTHRHPDSQLECLEEARPLVKIPLDYKNRQSVLWRTLMQRSDGRPIVCLHIRDAAYKRHLGYRNTGYKMNSEEEDHRNASCSNFIAAVHHLIDRDYFVVRTGSIASHRFSIDSSSFWDYPFSPEASPEWDVFLPFACTFFLAGANSGYVEVARLWGKPILFCNYLPAFYLPASRTSRYMFLIKHNLDLHTGRFLSLREVHSRFYGSLRVHAHTQIGGRMVDVYQQDYSSRQIILRENSENEILKATQEFEHTLNRDLDERLTASQSSFNAIYWELTGLEITEKSRISKSFLDLNPYLLF